MLLYSSAAYLDKFKTGVRARQLDAQKLGGEFYMREHTKPIFNEHEIFMVQSLYYYHVILNFYKIMKTHTPISVYSDFTKSHRKETLIITPRHSQHFVYKASSLWNEIRSVAKFSNICDFSISLSQIKTRMRELLYQRQRLGDPEEWSDENFLLS